MRNLGSIESIDARAIPTSDSRPWAAIWPWIVGTLVALLLGSWLVWLSAFLQRKFAEDDIRAACHRVMPETAERCFDTVVIQRGGIRR
jgi:hypothetical protein